MKSSEIHSLPVAVTALPSGLVYVAQHAAPIGSWDMRIADYDLSWSAETCSIFRIDRKDFKPTFDFFLSHVLADDRRQVLDAVEHIFQGGASLNLEYRIVLPSGEVRHVHASGRLVAAANGESIISGTVQDITERKLGEAEAVRNARLLKMASRVARMGTWQFESSERCVLWSDEVCSIHDMPPGYSPTVEEAIAFYPPEWRGRIAESFTGCLRDGTPYDEELSIITAKGRRVWVRTAGEPIRGPDNTITGVQGLLQDLTRFKATQEKADSLTVHLANTLESITDAFYTMDREWRVTYMNKEAERLLQRPRRELLGKVLWDEFIDLKECIIYREYHRAVQENCTVVFESFYAPLQLWSEVRAYPSEEGLTVYFRDITAARQISEALRQSEERFKIVARFATDAVWDLDPVSGKLWRSENMHNLFGYSTEDFASGISTWIDRIHPEDSERVLRGVDLALKDSSEIWTDEYRFMRKDGSIAQVLDRGIIIRDESGKPSRVVGAMVDLTAQKEAQEKQRQSEARIHEQASLLDKAKDAIVVRGIDNRVRFWNKGAERLYGWTAEEVLGIPIEDLLYDDPEIFSKATRLLLEKGEWSGEITEKHKDGTPLSVEVNWTLMRDENGKPQSIFAIKTDITQRKMAEQKIHRLAFYDTLTALPNRQLLTERLQRCLAKDSPHRSTSALLFIDLDNFKTLNDTLGHTTGDLLLQQVAQRLTGCVRSTDTVARLGGDEFIILLEGLNRAHYAAICQARVIGEKILAELNRPFQLGHHEYHSTPSIGITLFSNGQQDIPEGDIGELLKRADLAMYQAKAAGRNTLRFFNQDMQTDVTARAAMEADLRHALRENQFMLQYQPQVDAKGRVVAVEALVRWCHPERGLVSPADFIPLCEETGLITPLGQWVLEQACMQLKLWSQQPGMAHLNIAVNVSARQFHHPEFVRQTLAILDRTGVDPRRIKLELTESVMLDCVVETIAKMQALRSKGIGFSLDDFGTGYSSLTYLKRLPLDALKIDQSFTRDLLSSSANAEIATTIISLGRNLGLTVIAEGVENVSQQEFLLRNGCNLYQGYLFSAPLDARQLKSFMLENSNC